MNSKKYSVAILGCVKNCNRYLDNVLFNMYDIANMFKDFRILIYENDSIDGTQETLIKFSKKDNRILVSINNIKKNIMPNITQNYRTWNIANARQILLNNLKNMDYNPDYVIVMDMDDVGEKINKGKYFIKHALSINDKWDGLFPHPSYDLWAFRKEGLVYNLMEFKDPLSQPNLDKEIQSYMSKLRPYFDTRNDNQYDSNGLMKVFSSFNGIGIYKYNIYCRGVYSGKNLFYHVPKHLQAPKEHFQECEHVNFHRSLGPQTKLRITKDIRYPI
jgi:glycosyltransferase involved in cell wall biosynthesis